MEFKISMTMRKITFRQYMLAIRKANQLNKKSSEANRKAVQQTEKQKSLQSLRY